MRVAARSIDDSQVQTQLEHGDIDLAQMAPGSTPAELHARRLFDERYVCALRANHPDAGGGCLSLERFCALEHALVSYAGGGSKSVTDEALARLGWQRHVAVSVNNFLALPDVLHATDLVAVVPRRLVLGAAGLALLEPPIDIPVFTKVAVWHERTHRDPGHQWARALLFEPAQVATPEARFDWRKNVSPHAKSGTAPQRSWNNSWWKCRDGSPCLSKSLRRA